MDTRSWGTLATALVLVGCATSRGTLEVGVPIPPDPASELAFQQPVVEDARPFEAAPRDPSIPSLKNASDIQDAAIKSRAIARKRNSYGMAMGDILLPEGQTVEALARDAITRAYRSAGYSVLAPSDPGYAEALPLSARVDQFWAWVTPGFWAMAIEFEARMRVTCDLDSFSDGKDVRGYMRLKSAAVSSEKWRTTIDRGLSDFSASLEKSLDQARLAGPAVVAPRAAPSAKAGDPGIER